MPKNSGIWKYVPSDKFPISTLKAQLKFYQNDLKLSEDYLKYVRRYKSIPNYPWLLKRAQEDVRISKVNLRLIQKAIAKHLE